MAQEQQNQEKMSHHNNSCTWLVWGLAVSFLAALIYMASFGIFSSRAGEQQEENPLAMEETADWLMEQAYMLYARLQCGPDMSPRDYLKFYLNAGEDSGWIWDEELYHRFLGGDGNPAENEEEVPEDVGQIYVYLSDTEKDYFQRTLRHFDQLNNSFDYYCEDLETGNYYTNLGGGELEIPEQYFYLSLLFDQNGECHVEKAVCGDDSERMRRIANKAAGTFSLATATNYADYEEIVPGGGLDDHFVWRKPVNCRVIFAVSREAWNRYQQGDPLLLHDMEYSTEYSRFVGYMDSGIMGFFTMLWLGVILLAFWLPYPVDIVSKSAPRHTVAGLGVPAEGLLCLGGLWGSVGMSLCFYMTVTGINGNLYRTLKHTVLNSMPARGLRIVAFGLELLVFATIFLLAWYIGANLRDLRSLGLGGYIRERSLIWRFFPFVRAKGKKFYDEVSHIDLTKKANKQILRLVLVNGVILFFISSLWLGGLGIALVYSVGLYIVLRKYVSGLQKKYGILLRATNQIAQGNLNVQIREDLGVFEPFKPQIYSIQSGFKKAADEEVKSQRMKAELITNVSHDLKTPLTAIITYINLLKGEDLTPKQRAEYLDTLERKSMRLKVLIEDLFEVSKANSRNMPLNIMDVDIMNLVRQVAFEMGDKLAERRLELRFSFPEGRVILPLDSQRTYRIYENLFGNIAKYALNGTRVYVNGFCEQDRVVIVLKNIAAEELRVEAGELAERFVRGDTSRGPEGSGLGLAIAKSFTELQGGELIIETDGDLFKVTTVWKSGAYPLTVAANSEII